MVSGNGVSYMQLGRVSHLREANTLQLQHGLRYDFSVVQYICFEIGDSDPEHKLKTLSKILKRKTAQRVS